VIEMGFSTSDGVVEKCVRYIVLGEESPAVKRCWVLTAFILAQLLDYINEIRNGVCPFCKKSSRNLFNHLMYDEFCSTVFNSLIMRGVELHRRYGLTYRYNIRKGKAKLVFGHECKVYLEKGISIEETAIKIRDAVEQCLS
jgi:hypothetical protein